LVRAGHDPLQLFKEHPGRFKMWHVKDMDKVNPDWNAEIGSGSINFKAIFAKAELAGMKRFYLEHESNYKPNPIESAITSFNYISKSLI
jgi:sugar phosphate isomerase/epimerase